MTYGECYERGQASLAAAGIEEAGLDARLLLEHICHTDRNALLIHGDREVTKEEAARYEKMIEERAGHVPLAYITGGQEFMGLVFEVDRRVLIPRQDTEILVEEVLKNLHDGMRILDMCTGSGCILISLLKYSNRCEGTGVDISAEALRLAESNAARLLPADATFRFIESNLFENILGQYEFIVSNPPYIRSGELKTLMPEVRDCEPTMALDGGADGLDFYRNIIKRAKDYLVSGGMLYFEIGYDEAKDVVSLMRAEGFREVQVVKDYAGLDRVVYGTWIREG